MLPRCLILLLALAGVARAQAIAEKVIWPEGGKAGSEFTIVLIAEGYKKEELDKFHKDCDEFRKGLFAIPPYDQLSSFFTFIAVDAESKESGSSRLWKVRGKDEPADWKGSRDTKMKIRYDIMKEDVESKPGKLVWYGIPNLMEGRGAMGPDSTKERIMKALDRQPSRNPEVIVVITNDEDISAGYADDKPPAGAGPNFLIVSSYDLRRGKPAQTFAHELGHAMFHLGDEYFPGPPGCSRSSAGYANIDIEKDPTKVKWAHLTKAIKGPHEGALYCPTGKYRPEAQCRMNNETSPRFCAPCVERMIQRIDENPWIIESTTPEAAPNKTYKLTRFGGGMVFTVKCRGGASSSLQGVWTMDGELIGKRGSSGPQVTQGATGPTFTLNLAKSPGWLEPGGTHKLKFMTSARLVDKQEGVPSSPRNSREWNIYISGETFPFPEWDNFWEDKK